jgi:hypothetical protein
MQEPRVCSYPEYASSAGQEAVELAAMAGLYLDPWQQFVLVNALGERADGKWAAFEVGLNVPRQNGKDAILEAREIAGLFLFGERLLIHSAHQFDTSLEHFRRLLFLIENTPDFDRRVMRVSRSHGEEGIELRGGQRIRFRTRTKGGGRGFTGDFLALNEAMVLPESTVGALLPTLSARPNPQVWYTGSAVDQAVHEYGIVFARIRERGLHGNDSSLAYFEHSAEALGDDGKPLGLDDIPASFAADPEQWARANPSLGIRITAEHIANERASMDARTFAVERLGIGDYPATDGSGAAVIKAEVWAERADHSDPPPPILDPVCFAFDITPDRSSASIGVAGKRADGHSQIEVVENKSGTGWVVPRLIGLAAKNDGATFICDAYGPAASLLRELEEAGITVEAVTAADYANACGLIFDLVDQKGLRHLGSSELTAAVKGAGKRPLGERWAWARKGTVDISPLVACTLALWGSHTFAGDYGFDFGDEEDDA